MTDKSFEIEHNEHKNRFEITVDGREAGYASYVERGNKLLDFNHTVVDQAFRGQGLSTPLIKAALDWARDEGASVRTTCSAVEHFVKKNEEYRAICVE